MEKKKKLRKIVVRTIEAVMFLLYMALLIYLLLFSERYGHAAAFGGPYRYNLVPFKEINRFITHARVVGIRSMVLNIGGDIVAFMPFGFLFPMVVRRLDTAIRVALAGFLVSLLAETLQLVTRVGRFDVDDLILNTFGTWMGYLVYLAVGWVRINRSRFQRHRKGRRGQE